MSLKKSFQKMYDAPRGVPKCSICCVMGLFVVHSHFPPVHTLPVLSSPYFSSPISPTLPFLQGDEQET